MAVTPKNWLSNWIKLAEQSDTPATPAAGSVLVYPKDDKKLYILDSDGLETDIADAGGAVSDTAYDATSWNGVTDVAPSKNAIRDKIESMGTGITLDDADPNGLHHRLDTPHADDDEFVGTSISGSWTEFIAGTGSAVWSQGNHALHCLFDSIGGNKLAVIAKAVTLADGEAFETLTYMMGSSAQYPFRGIFISDGLTVTSNAFLVALYNDTSTPQLTVRAGTMQAMTTQHLLTTQIDNYSNGARLKLFRTNSTNFGFKISTINGYTFLSRPTAGTTYNPGFTPTHAGLMVSTWGGTDKFLASFNYFRHVSA